MIKKIIIGTIAVFIAISILDFVIHSLLLMGLYEETKNLWRPMEEIKIWVNYLVILIFSFSFVYIYAKLITPKSIKNSFLYGLLFGIASGVTMGYGTYSFMPIPYLLAASWFWTTVIELSICGILVGLVIKD